MFILAKIGFLQTTLQKKKVLPKWLDVFLFIFVKYKMQQTDTQLDFTVLQTPPLTTNIYAPILWFPSFSQASFQATWRKAVWAISINDLL